MNLDKRINKIAIIYDCFDSENARELIGEKGYFSHFKSYFSDLSRCEFSVLRDVIDGTQPYYNGELRYEFFLPDRYVAENQEKQLRPYTFMEFTDKFTVGSIITFRRKAYTELIHNVMFIGYREDDADLILLLGNAGYSLEELFNEYEYKNSLGKWVPFGKRVEE